MASYFVDAASGDDSTGDGSVGSPWETIQHALTNSVTGDQINVRDNAAHNLSSSLDVDTTHTGRNSITLSAIAGYNTAENDGGIAEIVAPSGSSSVFAGNSGRFLLLKDLVLDANGATGTYGFDLYFGKAVRCCFCGGGQYLARGHAGYRCWYKGGTTANAQGGNHQECLFSYGDTDAPYYVGLLDGHASHCFFHYDSAVTSSTSNPGSAIRNTFHGSLTYANSIYRDDANDIGIYMLNNRYQRHVARNLIEGGDQGILSDAGFPVGLAAIMSANAAYNQATVAFDFDSATELESGDSNEIITGGSPFAQAGNGIPTDTDDFKDQAQFWADVHDWFRPTSYAPEINGVVPGAVSPSGSGGGASGFPLSRIVN